MGRTWAPRTVQADDRTLVPCPACGAPFVWPPSQACERCGADLTGPVAASIFDLDREVGALRTRRLERVEELRFRAAPAIADLPPPVVARPLGRASSVRPQLVLAAAGAVLLLAAVVVFIAVTWPTWPPAAQVALVAAVTAGGALGARGTARRDLSATADALGVVTLAVAGFSLVAAQADGLAGLERVGTLPWVAAVATGVALVARPFARWAGLRDVPRWAGMAAALGAAGGWMVWLVDVVTVADPPIVLLAVAPAAAVLLLLHGWWVLRASDPVRAVVPVAPGLLLVGAALGTGSVGLTGSAAVAALLAAAVGWPLLVWARVSDRGGPWGFMGAALLVFWGLQFTTFLLADATAGALGLATPKVVTLGVAAAVVAGAARVVPPAAHWRDPLLVAVAAAAAPAVLLTLALWVVAVGLLGVALEAPLTGWPASEAPTVADVVLAVAAIVVVALVVDRVRRDLLVPVVGVASAATVLAAVVAAAAAGLLPMGAPLAVAGVGAGGGAILWQRAPARWPVVAATHSAACFLAGVDLQLLALTTTVVAMHLLWMAWRRALPTTGAVGAASALAAIATTTHALSWPLVTTTLLVTSAAGAILLGAQVVGRAVTWRQTPTDLVVAAASLLALGTAATADEWVAVAVELAIVAVVAAVHALRPDRGWAAWVSSTAASLAVVVLLGDRGVDVVEAYTLPAAAALAVAGAWRLRTTTASSWSTLLPACAMAAAPTLAVLTEASDPTRVVLLASGAVVVGLLGHWRGLVAPLVAGSVTAALAAVIQLWDWSAHLPRWVTFLVLGGVLLWASATYERQLRRAREVGAHLRRLR